MSERIDLASDNPLATLTSLLLTDPTLVGGSVLEGEESTCGCNPFYMVTRDAYSQQSPVIPPREGILYGAHMTDEFDWAGNIDPHTANELLVNTYTPHGTTSSTFAVERDSLRPVYVSDLTAVTVAARSILAAYGIES